MVPAPYSVRWTSKLIRRDLKAIAADCTARFRNIFSCSADAAITGFQDNVEEASLSHTEGVHDDASLCSLTSFATAGSEPTSSAPVSSASSFQSSAADSGANAPLEADEASLRSPTSLYSLLSTKLKDLYASRRRDLPLSERWLYRGAWLILDMATQHCASNPSHAIYKIDSSHVDETALLLEVLQYIVSEPLKHPTLRVSQMPTMPCTKHKNESSRQDSVFSTASSTVSSQPPPIPLALLWYTIFAGASDQAMTVHAAESLINHVWVGKDATALLEVVGNPAKRLSEDDDSELRKRLGYILHSCRSKTH